MVILFLGSLAVLALDAFARCLASVAAKATCARIDQDSIEMHAADRFTTPASAVRFEKDSVILDDDPQTGVPQIIDLAATYAAASDTLPFTPDELIAKAKAVLLSEFGCLKPELLSDDFQFIFPVVGPLLKDKFIEAFSSFKVREAFPDGKGNYFNFCVDPLEPNRVWFMSRGVLTHTSTLKFGSSEFKATGRRIKEAPQTLSMSFDDAGRCYKLTGGYCVDRTCGDSGGLGGLFGVIYALGGSLPFPEGKPWKPSLSWLVFTKHMPQLIGDWKKILSGNEGQRKDQ